MQKIFTIILCLLLIGCVSPDPRKKDYPISTGTYEWNYNYPLSFENELFAIRLLANKNSAGIFESIADRYAVASESSAARYLSRHYDICLLEVENKTDEEQIFYLNKLHLVYNGQNISPLSSFDVPSAVDRMNPQGISKNIYNVLVITTITAAVLGLIALTGMEGIRGWGPGPSFGHDPPSSGSKEEELWSSLYHDTRFQYQDLIINENPIAPQSQKSGIVFIPKGKLKFDSRLHMVYE
jgi:hypothetical protein